MQSISSFPAFKHSNRVHYGIMKAIGVIDSETDPFLYGREPVEFIWGLYLEERDGCEYYQFKGEDCTLQLMDFLAAKGWKGIIYAHNGGKFDYYFLLKHLAKFDFDYSINMIKSRISKLKFFDVEFRDSYLILPVPLAATGDKLAFQYWKLWADTFNLTEKELNQFDLEIEKAGIEDNDPRSDSPRLFYAEEIEIYLRQDCLGLYQNVRGFIDRFGLGLTLANRSFAEMEKVNLKPLKSSQYRDEVYRPYFFGGRCQAFDIGHFEGELTYLDINSAYPYAMTFPHFWGVECDEYDHIDEVSPDLHQNCLIDLDCYSKGAFPVRTKNGISYPDLKGSFSVTGWEYVEAVKLGLVEPIKFHCVKAPHEIRDFKPFILKFYAEKLAAEKAGDKQGRLFAKLLMNSGFGRFAMNPENWSHHMLTDIYEGTPEVAEADKNQNEWEIVNRLEFAMLDVYERSIADTEKRFYNVATAASITGYVRAMMMKSIAGVQNILYCDTDSMIFEGTHNVELGDQLGEWAIEAKGRAVWIAGKKLYCFQEANGKYKTASKGVKLTPDQLKRVALGEKVVWQNFAPSYSMKAATKFIERTVQST